MICPICKSEFHGKPAISRKDNKTNICSDCGIVEAILAFETDKEKAQDFLYSILEYKKRAEEMNVSIDVHYDPKDESKIIELNKKN